jgi:hypothetical protein
LAILQQTVFAPLYGFSESDKINKFIASSAMAYGKAVTPAATTGVLSLATSTTDTTGIYFLMEEVTADGPSMFELDRGDFQYEKKAGTNTAVTVIRAKKGDIVRTKWVEVGATSVAIAVDGLVNLTDGVFTTLATGKCGKILNIITDSLGNTFMTL